VKNNKKLGIILLLAVSLPALFFSVYEIGSLSQSEEIIGEIYNNQLDVILSSVNQYSSDEASSWAYSFNNILSTQPNPKASIEKYLNNYPSIKGFFYTKDTAYEVIELSVKDEMIKKVSEQQIIIQQLLKQNKQKTNKLFGYFKGGYRKIEPLSSGRAKGLVYFIFVARDYSRQPFICGMIINTEEFVIQVLAPKIQSMVKESFIIHILNGNKSIYSSESASSNQLSIKKNLWLLPDLKLGIVYKGRTIQQLVRDRTMLNFGLIIIIEILFLIGTWYVFRSFKTELQLARMRSDFISNVSHEIRTPLALISLYIETILLGRHKPEKTNEYHQIIYQETNRLTAIVNKILNFSKIEEKKYQYNFTQINLNELLEVVMERFDYHLKNSGFDVNINTDKKLPNTTGDREALIEVLINLIDNAIKYSTTEKKIEIETVYDKTNVFLTISDKGMGIPESQQKFIFDKFYRGTESEVHNIKGSGLGLAIVKHIVEGHKGSITLESSVGKGTTFKLSFPLTMNAKL
jgi:two-component system phosphate regulon sensor histidine kinase PhoR